jgi:Mg-chelatase subunit ChlI
VEGIYDLEQRVEIIKRNLEFSEAPVEFHKKWNTEQDKLKKKIMDARKHLRKIDVPTNLLRGVASACIELHVDGHRPDIATIRAAKALAALENFETITKENIMKVAVMAVGHRSRGFGFEEPAKPSEVREVFSRIIETG